MKTFLRCLSLFCFISGPTPIFYALIYRYESVSGIIFSEEEVWCGEFNPCNTQYLLSFLDI